jgi:hypothetical protein
VRYRALDWKPRRLRRRLAHSIRDSRDQPNSAHTTSIS